MRNGFTLVDNFATLGWAPDGDVRGVYVAWEDNEGVPPPWGFFSGFVPECPKLSGEICAAAATDVDGDQGGGCTQCAYGLISVKGGIELTTALDIH